MKDIIAGMTELAERRNERYSADIRLIFPALHTFESMTWIGHYSYTNAEIKRRFLDEAVILDNVTGFQQTPPEVARDYLRTKYTEKRRHTKAQYAAINLPRSAPTLCKVGKFTDHAYIDLKAAYWSIITAVGWDVDYHPGRWLGKRSENDDFPIPDNKLARNCLATAGLMTPTHIWTGKMLKPFQGHNTLVNYDLWAVLMDTLHGIASIAKRLGAIYIHTDGYILPAKNVEAFQTEVQSWGLRTGVKGRGDGEVFAVSCYTIGEFSTKHRSHFRGQDRDTVYEPDIGWLKPRISKLSLTKIHW